MNQPRRILVVSMCTRHCVEAIKWGVSLARGYEAELFIIHIFHNPFGLEGWNLPIPSVEEEFNRMTEQMKEKLDRYIKSEDTAGLSIKESVIEGKPKDQILNFIQTNKIDLLVMTAHKQEHIEYFIFGGEIRNLVRKMPCSILLAKRE
jgi:nucleotide-binding universal stress UspA family protein